MTTSITASVDDQTAILRRVAARQGVAVALLSPPEWRFADANDACRRLGDSRLIGSPLAEMLPSVADGVDAAALRSGRTLTLRGRALSPPSGGAATAWDVDLIPLPGASDPCESVLLIARPSPGPPGPTPDDRTDRVAAARQAELARTVADRTKALALAEADLRRQIAGRAADAEDLARARKLETLGHLARIAGHDFNNKLAVVSGNLELLEHRLTDDGHLELVRDAYDAAWRTAALAGGLLGLLRGRDLAPQVIDVAHLLHGAGRSLAETLGEAGTVTVAADSDLWPVVAAPDRLLSAVLDMMLAARDAMPPGGRLTLQARNLTAAAPRDSGGLADGATVAIAVDGLPAAELWRMEPAAADESRDDALAAVRRFAAEAGGALRVAPAIERGGAIELLLPRARVAPLPADDADPSDRLRLHGGATILVAEEDSLLRAVIARMLRVFGYDVLEAASADAAYATAVVTDRLDLLMCNPVLSHGGRTDLWWRLQALRPSLPFLLYASPEADEVPFTAIALRTPFTRRQLGAAVLHRLGRDGTDTNAPGGRPGRSERIRNDVLRGIYDAWYDGVSETSPPAPSAFDPAEFGVVDRSFLALCTGAESFRFLSVGGRLSARLRNVLEGETIGLAGGAEADADAALGSLEAAYARCRRSRRPVYEYARFDLGDGAPLLFERLLLPLSADGSAITHVAGVVLVGEPPTAVATKG